MAHPVIKAVFILAALSVSACTSADRFGGSDGSGAGGVNMAGGTDDPRSPAYFQNTIGDRVLFTVDQTNLTPGAEEILTGQARWMIDNPSYNAVVEGHADEQGTREYNLGLGARRANSVQEYLIAQGISPARLKTVTYGKERPIEICSDESCYAQNRRAVTVLQAGAGS